MAQVLLDLAKIITDAAQTIDAECKTRGTTFPLLDEPFTPQSEAIRDEPAVANLTAVLAAAAEQIMLTAWSPPRSLFDGAFGVCALPGLYFDTYGALVPHVLGHPYCGCGQRRRGAA